MKPAGRGPRDSASPLRSVGGEKGPGLKHSCFSGQSRLHVLLRPSAAGTAPPPPGSLALLSPWTQTPLPPSAARIAVTCDRAAGRPRAAQGSAGRPGEVAAWPENPGDRQAPLLLPPDEPPAALPGAPVFLREAEKFRPLSSETGTGSEPGAVHRGLHQPWLPEPHACPLPCLFCVLSWSLDPGLCRCPLPAPALPLPGFLRLRGWGVQERSWC